MEDLVFSLFACRYLYWLVFTSIFTSLSFFYMDTINEAYSLGKAHKEQTLSNVFELLQFIEKQNFTCDQLHQLILGIDDIR